MTDDAYQSYIEFPACAGMIRESGYGFEQNERVPRMRGDDPHDHGPVAAAYLSSPHARG